MDKGAAGELDVRGRRRALRRLPHRGRERLLLRQGQGRRDERPHLPGPGLQNGRTYYYSVLPVGSNPSCFGLMSACATVVPVDGPNLAIQSDITLGVSRRRQRRLPGQLRVPAPSTFTVENNGTGTLTNVRLVAVTPLTHPGTTSPRPCPQVARGQPHRLRDRERTASASLRRAWPSATDDPARDRGDGGRAGRLDPQPVISHRRRGERYGSGVASRTYDYETDYSGWTSSTGRTTARARAPAARTSTCTRRRSSTTSATWRARRDPPDGELHAVPLATGTTPRRRSPSPTTAPTSGSWTGHRHAHDHRAQRRTPVRPAPGTLNGACVTDGEAGWAGTQLSVRHQHVGFVGHEPGRRLHRPRGPRRRRLWHGPGLNAGRLPLRRGRDHQLRSRSSPTSSPMCVRSARPRCRSTTSA